MKIEIPPIVKPLDLGDYAEELRGVTIEVWVNCPRVFQNGYYDLLREAKLSLEAAKQESNGRGEAIIKSIGGRISVWVAELWSKGGNTWTAEDVSALANSDTDPALYPWALNRSWALIADHRDKSKKK